MIKSLRRLIFNVCIICVLVSTGGMYAISIVVDKLSKGWYLQNDNLGFLFSLLVLIYLIAFTTMVLMAAFKYSNDESKKLCSETNCKLFVLSWMMFYPLSA